MDRLGRPAGRADEPSGSSPLVSTAVKAAAVLYVKQLDRMGAFYQECFALTAAETAGDYRVLESDAWTLSLVVVPDEIARGIQLATPPRRRHHAPIKLAFVVPNIEAVRSVVAGRGGRLDPRETQWDFRGFRHCDGVDPEGNVMELLEPIARPQ
jgi:predicted enzyme related to lactoylglutathione lyase